jgi:acyl carrier protein
MAAQVTDGVLLAVRAAIAETLGLDDDAITAEAGLERDLGAGAFELLEVLRRIDEKLGVRLTLGEVAAQGHLVEEAVGLNARPWLQGDLLMAAAENTCRCCTVGDLVAAVREKTP